MLTTFEFDNPLLLWLMLPVLVWVWQSRFIWRSLPSASLKHAFADRFLSGSTTAVSVSFKRWLWGVSGILCVMALAKPVILKPAAPQVVPLSQQDVVLSVELSVNMLLQESDGQTRLGQAQQFVDRLLAVRDKQSRLGLVVFADDAFPVLTLTQDHQVLTAMMSRLSAALAGREDSALLEAIQLAAWQAWEANQGKPAWVVCITDGAHATSRGKLADVMAWLNEHHIQLAVLMVGGEQSSVQSASSGLLYTPKSLSFAESLAPYHVPVFSIDQTTEVQSLLGQLSKSSLGDAEVVSQQTFDHVDVTQYVLYVMLMFWLAMWLGFNMRKHQNKPLRKIGKG